MGLYYGEESNGDFLPYLGFNAKSDKWFLNVNQEKVALKGDVVFVADLANIKTGWFLFQEGGAPMIVLDESLEKPAANPGGKYKRGAKFALFMKGDHPGVYEFSTNSKNVMMALSDLHDAYLEGEKSNKGKLPVVAVKDSLEVKCSFKNEDGSNGAATNYKPVFSIDKWVDRPKEFDSEPVKVEEKPVQNTGASEF